MARKNKGATTKGETKREKFVRLCEYRMDRVLKYMRAIGALASPNYEWTKEDGEKVVTELTAAVEGIKNRFAGKPTDGNGFKLS